MARRAAGRAPVSEEQIQRRVEGLRMLRNDLVLFSSECLKIKPKVGDLKPLIYNRAQLYLHARLEEQKARTGRVRAILGKMRQGGGSTYIGSRFYHQTTMAYGVETFILTHEQSATEKLFEMVERFHKHCPLKPSTSLSNAKELVFDILDSGYSVGTAGTKALGRSRTIQRLHGSEVAFWPNAKDHFAGIVQTVTDAPGTEIILESTGHGASGEFFERWQQAEARQGDYEAIFLPWFWAEEYSRPVPPGFRLDSEEAEYAAVHGVSLEAMVWRRAKLAELRDPALFMQEYPATATEMFQNTGHDSFIKPEDVLAARKATHEGIGPLVVGVDPSRFGDDRFSVAWRRGRKVERIESRTKVGTADAVAWLKQIVDRDKPSKMFVDVGGGGDRIADIMHAWGAPYDTVIVLVNFGGKARDSFETLPDGTKRAGPKNRRAEMWRDSRDWLTQVGGADLPDLDPLMSDACAPGFRYDMTTQQLILESKEEMRKRGVRSPDEWDAVALTFAEPVKEPRPMPTSRARVSGAGAGATAWMAS